jgi:catechol 2,3-dioxygenase-like lactoylglutathione lyase family enzyme
MATHTPLRARHQQAPASRGIHHLALNTDDMKGTVDFYTQVLGMPLVHALRVPPGVGVGAGNRGNPPYENLRHYFFDAGGDTLVAFFEFPKGAVGQCDRNTLAAMQHCSFTTTKAQFDLLHERLKANGVPLIGPIPVGAKTWSMYFFDLNGIRLEYSWQEDDGENVHVVERWTQTQEEIREELETLTDDACWIRSRTAHLPDRREGA